MTTVRSSFSAARFLSSYRNTLKRFRGSWIFYAALSFAVLPLQYIMTVAKWGGEAYRQFAGPAGVYNAFAMIFFTGLTLITPIVLGVNLCSYMHSKRAVDVYHSLPATRQELFFSNAAVGVTILWSSILLNFAVILCLDLALAFGGTALILQELFSWMAVSLAIFAITLFCAVNVGTVFDTWIFTLAMCGVLPIVSLVTSALFSSFLYGYMESSDRLASTYMLSPVSSIIGRQLMNPDTRELSQNTGNMLFWLLVGLVLLCVACAIYRNRKSEAAETVGSLGALQVIMRIAGTYVCGLSVGAMLVGVFSIHSKLAFVVLAAVGCIIAYLIGDLLLTRSIKAIGKALLPGACCTGAVIAVLAVIMTGGLGYEKRVPAIEKVEAVSIGYFGRYGDEPRFNEAGLAVRNYQSIVLASPEAVQIVHDMHKAQVEYYNAGSTPNEYQFGSTGVQISYEMKNGAKMERRYYDNLAAEAADCLAELESNPEFITAVHPVFHVKPEEVERLTIRSVLGDKESEHKLTTEQVKSLFEAVQKDLLEQKTVSATDFGIKATGYLTINVKGKPVPDTELNPNSYGYTTYDSVDRGSSYYDVNVLVLDSYRNTLSELSKLGFLGEILSDEGRITKVQVGLLPYPVERVSSEVRQTSVYALDEVASEAEYSTCFLTISKEELESLRPYLSNVVRNRYTSALVAISTMENEIEEVTGYYYVPLDKLPREMKVKLTDLAEDYYGYSYYPMTEEAIPEE